MRGFSEKLVRLYQKQESPWEALILRITRTRYFSIFVGLLLDVFILGGIKFYYIVETENPQSRGYI